nr:uncharacterized protein LOC109431060 [Aedes albopictus]XP_029729485.1 uncharacterized protein LOC115266930 [Aedes albopictus]
MKMMVLIGSVPTAAHRGQLRISKTGESHEKPNVLLRRQQLEFHEDGGEFRGFSEEEIERTKPRNSKQTVSCPRSDVLVRQRTLVPEADFEKFRGAPEDVRRSRKRRMLVEEAAQEVERSTDCVPRRSKRLRRANIDSDYVYLN